MKRSLILISIGVIIFSILLGLRACQAKRDKGIVSPILRADVDEKIIVNPSKHSLVIINRQGTQALVLPDRASSIEVLKTGKLRLTVPQYGFIVSPFIGIGWGGQLNDYVGCDLFYWKRLDVGMAFSFDRELKIRSLGFPLVLSATIWHNMRLSLGYEAFGSKTIHGFVSVRL